MSIATLLVVLSIQVGTGARALSVTGVPTPPEVQLYSGNGWLIYLAGNIDADSGTRLDAFIEANRIPYTSHVILNSPGGDLLGAIELGKVIRKHRLSTGVGAQGAGGTAVPSVGSGVCFDACAVAYLGGRFRFFTDGSRYGVHGSYFTGTAGQTSDAAGSLPAPVADYLKEMDIDPAPFAAATAGGADELVALPKAKLEALRVVTNGSTETKWTVENAKDLVYLKGQRDTVFGINKFILRCDRKIGVVLVVIFDPQGRDEEMMSNGAHSLVIDGKGEPISPAGKGIENGWFNASYKLSAKQIRAIETAGSVGVMVRASYQSPIFFGFDRMPFEDGAPKLQGLLQGCRPPK